MSAFRFADRPIAKRAFGSLHTDAYLCSANDQNPIPDPIATNCLPPTT